MKTSVVVETICFETKAKIKTAKFFRDHDRDQDQSSFETFGLRPRPGIIETETGNYAASKHKSVLSSLINLFLYFHKITFQVNEDF